MVGILLCSVIVHCKYLQGNNIKRNSVIVMYDSAVLL